MVWIPVARLKCRQQVWILRFFRVRRWNLRFLATLHVARLWTVLSSSSNDPTTKKAYFVKSFSTCIYFTLSILQNVLFPYERHRYFAIVSYKIFVDYILVYYLKIIFWYHAKGYHLVLHRLCSKLTLHFILKGLGTTLDVWYNAVVPSPENDSLHL